MTSEAVNRGGKPEKQNGRLRRKEKVNFSSNTNVGLSVLTQFHVGRV